jgi:hypothetical protein
VRRGRAAVELEAQLRQGGQRREARRHPTEGVVAARGAERDAQIAQAAQRGERGAEARQQRPGHLGGLGAGAFSADPRPLDIAHVEGQALQAAQALGRGHGQARVRPRYGQAPRLAIDGGARRAVAEPQRAAGVARERSQDRRDRRPWRAEVGVAARRRSAAMRAACAGRRQDGSRPRRTRQTGASKGPQGRWVVLHV